VGMTSVGSEANNISSGTPHKLAPSAAYYKIYASRG
jgi:hypothetical protein